MAHIIKPATADDYRELGQQMGAWLERFQRHTGWSDERLLMFLIAVTYGWGKKLGWSAQRLTETAFQWWSAEDEKRRIAAKKALHE